MTTTDNTTTETESTDIQLGSGGIASVPVVGTLDQLIDVIVDKRESLVNTNQKNIEVFNELQKISAKITSNLNVLDGAISGISEFVTSEMEETDAHLVRLKELQENRSKAISELKLTNSRRGMLLTSIQAAEISLGILNRILERTGSSNIRSTDLSKIKTEEQVKLEETQQ